MESGASGRGDDTRRIPQKPLTFAGGRYTVIRPLGEGGQKVVYLVHDNALDRDCALSMVRSALLDSEDILRLNREAQAMARLGSHSHIVTVFDYGEEDGTPYLVCEYVPGGDLNHELKATGGGLPLDRALLIGAELADALAAAHARGVIHRDVKPANIWLDDAGHAKLGDFGLAFSLDRSRLTVPGTLMGTAFYVSPEQIQGEPATVRSDLYALGCVLYEMLCGRPPFVDDNPAAVIAQHLNATPAPPSAHNSSVPAAVDGMILRLLEKSPERRPATAQEVADELRVLRGGGSGQMSHVRLRLRRPRLLLAGALLVVALAATIGAIVVLAMRGSGNANSAAVARPLVADGYTPALEPRDCPLESSASGTDLRCYDLVVPENRAKPGDRQIRMIVLVAPSRAREPGVPTAFVGVDFNGGSLQASDVRDYGDVIILGNRGGVYAQPSLACPEISDTSIASIGLPTGPESSQLYVRGAEKCGQRLVSEGVDLNMYGIKEHVDDVRDLAIVMGLQNLNLEAHWQYSRLPNLLAARYPGLVRSVVLVDAYPPDGPSQDDIASYNSTFQAFFAACRGNTACNAAVPNIDQRVTELYHQLQQHPAVVTTPNPFGGPDVQVLIDGDATVFALISALQVFDPGLVAATLAVSVDDASRNATIAAGEVEFGAVDPAKPPWPYGVYLSQYCEDEDETQSRSGVQVQASLYPLFRGVASDSLLTVCAHWPTTARSGVLGAFGPAKPIPALLVGGGLDPFSPPDYARRAAAAFKDAKLAVFPPLGAFAILRGPVCAAELRLAFLRDPQANLDIDACVQMAVFTYPGS